MDDKRLREIQEETLHPYDYTVTRALNKVREEVNREWRLKLDKRESLAENLELLIGKWNKLIAVESQKMMGKREKAPAIGETLDPLISKWNELGAIESQKIKGEFSLTDLLYILTREGVYRHEILGVFSCLDEATKWCETAIREDSDDYHEYYVNTILPNQLVEDVLPLICFSRNGETVTRKDV